MEKIKNQTTQAYVHTKLCEKVRKAQNEIVKYKKS